MKILVTGGAGFIGSNVVDALIEKGHDIVVIDNLSSGKKENLNPKAKFCYMDIRDDLTSVFQNEKFDIVNHHAAQIDVRKSMQDPVHDAKINIMGFLNILQNSIKYNVKKFINISSGGVLYNNGEYPTKETAPKEPVSSYGVSKLTAEHYLNIYRQKIKFTTLRYSNVYGIRQDIHGEAGVVAIFSNQMLHGKQLTIFGDGKQTRDFVYVKDVVNANLLAMEKGDNEAFNIGTGTETDINALFNSLIKITNYQGDPKYQEARSGELLRSCLDISKAKNILGWKPKYSLQDGLKETVDWIKQTIH